MTPTKYKKLRKKDNGGQTLVSFSAPVLKFIKKTGQMREDTYNPFYMTLSSEPYQGRDDKAMFVLRATLVAREPGIYTARVSKSAMLNLLEQHLMFAPIYQGKNKIYIDQSLENISPPEHWMPQVIGKTHDELTDLYLEQANTQLNRMKATTPQSSPKGRKVAMNTLANLQTKQRFVDVLRDMEMVRESALQYPTQQQSTV